MRPGASSASASPPTAWRSWISAPATGAVVVLLDAMRERTMLSQRVPFAMRLRPELLAEAGWLVVSGYLLLEPDAGISGSRRLAASRPAGMLARLDRGRRLAGCRGRPAAAPRDRQRGRGGRDLRLRRGAVHARAPRRRAARSDRGRHAPGRRGRVPRRGVGRDRAPPAAEPAVDATGAGDAFSAGLDRGPRLRAMATRRRAARARDGVGGRPGIGRGARARRAGPGRRASSGRHDAEPSSPSPTRSGTRSMPGGASSPSSRA